MKSVFPGLLLMLAFFTGYGQVKDGIRLREVASYKTDVSMNKVVVCMDDRSVWAISENGKVYFKRNADVDFTEFAATAALTITEITGYNSNEMYFLTAGKQVYIFENNNLRLLASPLLVDVNNIAVVCAKRNETLGKHFGRRDWLAVATKRALYSVFREDPLKTPEVFLGAGLSNAPDPEFEISNAGFKSVDIRYKSNENHPCYGPTSKLYYSNNNLLVFPRRLRETGPGYSSNITCTYYEDSFNLAIDADGSGQMEYWGTDNGMFVANGGMCDPSRIFKKLDGIRINDLEELNVLRNVYNRRFMMIASDNGFYYISTMLYLSELKREPNDPEIETLEMIRLPMEAGKVKSIATELYSDAGQITADSYQMCEKTVWVATEKGIRQLAVLPSIFTSMSMYAQFITRNVQIIYPVATVCADSQLDLEMKFSEAVKNRLSIQWFRAEADYENTRQEITSLNGQLKGSFKTNGWYGYKLVDLCEGHIVDPIGIDLQMVPLPNVTFAPPPITRTCLAGSVDFTTEYNSAYTYRWYRDNRIISGATSNNYTADIGGVYRVEVRSCGNTFSASPSTTLMKVELPVPTIAKSTEKTLCFGETVTLSATAFDGASYKWNTGQTTREIIADKSGDYRVEMSLGNSCSNPSTPVTVTVDPLLKLETPPEAKICILRNQRLKLVADQGFITYTWDGVQGTSNVKEVTATGIYNLQVEDKNGCTANVSYVVVEFCSPVIPVSAFSPNGDGHNDLWTVGGLESDPDAIIKVYNRFGTTVFQGTGSNASWNGKFKGDDTPAGVYYFVVIKKSAEKPLTGSLTLIR